MVNNPIEVLTKEQKSILRSRRELEKQRLDRLVEKKFAIACQSTKLHNVKAARELVHSLPVAAFDRAIDINDDFTRRDFLAYLIRYVFMSIEPNTDRYKNYVPDLKRIKQKLEALEEQRKQERASKVKNSKNGRSLAGTDKSNEFMKINEHCPSRRHSPKKRILVPGRTAASPI